MQDLGVPDGIYDTSFARAINNNNEISGSVSNKSGAEAAFYWTATTGFILLSPGSAFTVDGQGINDFAELTGAVSRMNLTQAYL